MTLSKFSVQSPYTEEEEEEEGKITKTFTKEEEYVFYTL